MATQSGSFALSLAEFAAAIALLVGVMVLGLAGAAGFAAGLDDPAALTGLGIGMIAAIVHQDNLS